MKVVLFFIVLSLIGCGNSKQATDYVPDTNVGEMRKLSQVSVNDISTNTALLEWSMADNAVYSIVINSDSEKKTCALNNYGTGGITSPHQIVDLEANKYYSVSLCEYIGGKLIGLSEAGLKTAVPEISKPKCVERSPNSYSSPSDLYLVWQSPNPAYKFVVAFDTDTYCKNNPQSPQSSLEYFIGGRNGFSKLVRVCTYDPATGRTSKGRLFYLKPMFQYSYSPYESVPRVCHELPSDEVSSPNEMY